MKKEVEEYTMSFDCMHSACFLFFFFAVTWNKISDVIGQTALLRSASRPTA